MQNKVRTNRTANPASFPNFRRLRSPVPSLQSLQHWNRKKFVSRTRSATTVLTSFALQGLFNGLLLSCYCYCFLTNCYQNVGTVEHFFIFWLTYVSLWNVSNFTMENRNGHFWERVRTSKIRTSKVQKEHRKSKKNIKNQNVESQN